MSQTAAAQTSPQALRENNKVRVADQSVHDWYRFVLSFPPHLVRSYLERFAISEDEIVLDPFCGTGTTLVECKKQGIPSVGIEANPMPCFATRVKVNWDADPDALLKHATGIAAIACKRLALNGLEEYQNMPLFRAGKPKISPLGLRRLPDDAEKLLLTNSISPVPLHRVLVLMESIQESRDELFTQYERLALAKALVSEISNLEFGPEVGVGPAKSDAPAVTFWLDALRSISDDLREMGNRNLVTATVHQADSRNILSVLQPNSIDAVITSPPYPNEKDYTRTTRLESVLLGFIRNKQGLRALKQDLLRSNTRGVYKSDRDDVLVGDHEEIQRIAEAIENRRIELGKTSGFERLYARVTKLYFGGMARHLSDLRTVLRPGAQLAYVVGDQASYLRVMIRTGQLLADIADSLGYEVTGIDLFRTRLATATKEQLREEVMLLRWPGRKNRSRTTLMNEKNLYSAIIERIFQSKFKKGMNELDFDREELLVVAKQLGLKEPKNLGDLIYTFRYRAALPEVIKKHAGEGKTWIIRPAGRGKYRFVLVPDKPIAPNESLAVTKVPDATPGVVSKYALSDEQALLAKLRYNRLVDVFTGVVCYSLQNHLRTSVPNMGQAETDEIYVGLDKKGAHYVFPVQAKGGSDKLNIVQIEQDLAVCAHKFPSLICRPIGAQFMQAGVIALFEFEEGEEGLGIAAEKHYKLVPPDEVTDEDLKLYSARGSQ